MLNFEWIPEGEQLHYGVVQISRLSVCDIIEAIEGTATSVTLSANSASSLKDEVLLAEASTNRTFGGRRWRNSSLRKVLSTAPARFRSYCIHLSNCVGLRSPSSSVLSSCWSHR